MKKALLALCMLAMTACEPAGQVDREDTLEFTLPNGMPVTRYYVTTGHGNFHAIYVVDGKKTVSTTYKQGKTEMTTVTIDGVEYIKKP